MVFLFLGNGNDTPAEGGWINILRSALALPEFEFGFSRLFSWINLDDPTLIWIFTGIGGIMVLALLERLIDIIRPRQFYLL
jgi:hypothetical protein